MIKSGSPGGPQHHAYFMQSFKLSHYYYNSYIYYSYIYLRDPSLAHSASLPRSLVHALSARGPGLPVRSDTSVPSS